MNHTVLLILGILLLFLGRKLFWLSVAAIGFVLGVEMAPALFPHQPEIYVFAFGLFLGIIGAVLALFLQSLAIGVAGFFFGGHLALVLAAALATGHTDFSWLIFVIGGLVGAVVMATFFDWALIILSSLIGAHLIVDAFRMNMEAKGLLYLVLVAVGMVFQATLWRKRRPAAA